MPFVTEILLRFVALSLNMIDLHTTHKRQSTNEMHEQDNPKK